MNFPQLENKKMGRRRKSRFDLPTRVYFHHGYYRFVDKAGKWHKLGRQWNEHTITKYASLIGGSANIWMLRGLIHDYLEKVARVDKAESTYKGYLKSAKPLLKVFGHMDPNDVSPKDLYAYRRERNKSVAANREISLLSSVFQWGIELGVCETNPCRQVRRIKETPRDRAVTWQEFHAVHALAGEMMKCAMELAYMTGLREGRVLRIHRNDLKTDGLHATTGKRKSRKHVYPWTEDLRDVVERAKAVPTRLHRLYLIVNRDGQPYTGDGFRSNWHRLMQKALKEGKITETFTFHDIRSLSADEADNPTELLGHDDPRTTNRVYLRRPRTIEPLKVKR